MLYSGGAYVQTGNGIVLTNGVTANGGSATILLPITLSQSQTFTAAAAGNTLQFAGGTITTSATPSRSAVAVRSP